MVWNLTTEEQNNLESVARDEALLSQECHEYLPKTPEEAALFNPHEWVLEALRRAYAMGRTTGARQARQNIRIALGVQNVELGAAHIRRTTWGWRKRRDEEKNESSQADYEAYGTELTRMDGTMDDLYGDGSNHQTCSRCGMCLTCGDCAAHDCGQAPNISEEIQE